MAGNRKRPRALDTASASEPDKPWPEADPIVDELLSYLHSHIIDYDLITQEHTRISLDVEAPTAIAAYLTVWRNAHRKRNAPKQLCSARQVCDTLKHLYNVRKHPEDTIGNWRTIYDDGFASLAWTNDMDRMRRMEKRSEDIKRAWRSFHEGSKRMTRGGLMAKLCATPPPETQPVAAMTDGPTDPCMNGSLEIPDTPPSSSEPIDKTEAINHTEAINQSENTGTKVTDQSNKVAVKQSDALPLPKAADRSAAPLGEVVTDLPPAKDPNRPPKEPYLREYQLDAEFWKAECLKARIEAGAAQKAWLSAQSELNRLKIAARNIPGQEGLSSDQDDQPTVGAYKQIQEKPFVDIVRNVRSLMGRTESKVQEAYADAAFTADGLQALRKDPLLLSLVRKAFLNDQESFSDQDMCEELCKRPWSAPYDRYSLCGAAIASWVFEQAHVDSLLGRAESYDTVNRYWTVIDHVASSNPALAKAAHLQAHRKLMKTDDFGKLCELKAEQLARTLRQTLSPLCEVPPMEFEPLIAAFSSALEIQTELVLTGRQFQCVWHSPSTTFDEHNMRLLKEKFVTRAPSSSIKMAILPGIYLLQQQEEPNFDSDLCTFVQWPRNRDQAVQQVVESVVWY